MRGRIVKIGNSRGIRIPRPLLEQTQLEDEVEIQVADNRLVISPVRRAREGWESAFQQMAESGDDSLLDRDQIQATRWEDEEWEWS